MGVTWIAEDIPDFQLTGEAPPGSMREEDFALCEDIVCRSENEADVRQAMALHLIKIAHLRHVAAEGLTQTHLAASQAIVDGVTLVQIGYRVYRIRKVES